MILPNHDKAYVPSTKLDDYLLSTSHSVGKSKARFFRELGFDDDNISSLESELLSVAQTEDVISVRTTPFGVKYIIDGTLMTPVGVAANIRTVWIIEEGADEPRFVTAYPRSK